MTEPSHVEEIVVEEAPMEETIEDAVQGVVDEIVEDVMAKVGEETAAQ